MSIDRSDDELKHEVYAVLFSVGKRMLLDDIAKVVKEPNVERVKHILSLLKVELDAQAGPVVLIQEGIEYKLQVRSKFLDLVQKVVKQTELPKSILETLAIIAYKTPVLQSDIIRIRTNKAYDHLDMLEEKGFITRERHGRTRLVRVTNKFYEYFEVSPEILQKHITDRQIKEQGESQQKITTMMDTTASGLEIYQEDKLANNAPESPNIYNDAQADSSIVSSGEEQEETRDEEVDDTSTAMLIDSIDKTVFVNDNHDTETSNIVAAQDAHEHNDHILSGTIINKNKESGDDEEYEPPRVKGGFVQFSKKEKKNIKKRSEEITGDDD